MEKVPLMVTGDDAEVFIDLLLSSDGENGAGLEGADAATAVRRSNREGAQEAHYTNSLLIHLRDDNMQIRNEMTRMHERERRMMAVISKNLRQLMRNPALMHGRNVVLDRPVSVGDSSSSELVQEQNVDVMANLTRNPSTLHEIWNEWEFGIGNRKAAKYFTIRERGRCKYAYHRRKVVWDTIAQMVRCGWNSSEACNKVYAVYGCNSSVTSIINRMRKDRKHGGNPALGTLNTDESV